MRGVARAKIPGALILQLVDAGNIDIQQAALKELDNQQSQVVAPHTQGEMLIGYTADGLPFQLVLNVTNYLFEETFRFIEDFVIPALLDYEEQLLSAADATTATQELIHRIYQMRKQHAQTLMFTMSCALTYSKENRLYCAGFGIGDTSIFLHADQQDIPLTKPNFIIQDSIGENSADVKTVIKRNSLFNVPISVGDQLIGCAGTAKAIVTVPTIASQEKLKKAIFTQEQERLNNLVWGTRAVTEVGKKVYNEIESLAKDENNYPLLTRTLMKTNRAIIKPNPDNLTALHQYAESLQDENSLRRLGVGLMVLGGVLLVFSGLTFLASLSVLPTGIGVALTPFGFGGAALIGIQGLGLLASGYGLFRSNQNRSFITPLDELSAKCRLITT